MEPAMPIETPPMPRYDLPRINATARPARAKRRIFSCTSAGKPFSGRANPAGPFPTLETPRGLWNRGIHVHRFAAVAPAGRDREREADAFACEFLGASRRFRHAADAGVGNDAFDAPAVRITQAGRNQFRGGSGHVHRLFFERLADTAEPAVNRGADSDCGKRAVEQGWFHILNNF